MKEVSDTFETERKSITYSKKIKLSRGIRDNFSFIGTLNTEEQGESDSEDRSGIVTKMIFYDYVKSGGLIPGLTYIGVAILCQILRVYIDLWLSRWTDEDNANLAQENENV